MSQWELQSLWSADVSQAAHWMGLTVLCSALRQVHPCQNSGKLAAINACLCCYIFTGCIAGWRSALCPHQNCSCQCSLAAGAQVAACLLACLPPRPLSICLHSATLKFSHVPFSMSTVCRVGPTGLQLRQDKVRIDTRSGSTGFRSVSADVLRDTLFLLKWDNLHANWIDWQKAWSNYWAQLNIHRGECKEKKFHSQYKLATDNESNARSLSSVLFVHWIVNLCERMAL